MAQTKHDITIDKGASFEESITWTTEEKKPVDLTGATAKMQIRKTVESANAILSISSLSREIKLGGKDGTIHIEIPPRLTSKITESTGVYDLTVSWPTGRVVRLLGGSVKFIKGVTR